VNLVLSQTCLKDVEVNVDLVERTCQQQSKKIFSLIALSFSCEHFLSKHFAKNRMAL